MSSSSILRRASAALRRKGNGRAPHAGPAVTLGAVTPVAPVPAGDPPYLRGRAEFDSVFADLAKGKRNWQLAAFASLGVAAVLSAGLVTLAGQSRIVPYVVEVDRLGRAQAFGPAERLRATDQRVITSQLAGFVRDLRTVVADPVAQADLVRRAYAYVDQGAAPFLDAHFTAPANDPRVVGREYTRLVEVAGVLPVPSGAGPAPTAAQTSQSSTQTWKVSWTERVIPRAAGAPATTTAWESYVTTRVIPPATTDRITLNPLGLYVTSITWTQLAGRTVDSGAAGAPAAPAAPVLPAAPPADSPAGMTP